MSQRIRPYQRWSLTLFLKVILSIDSENSGFSFPCDNNTGSYSRYRIRTECQVLENITSALKLPKDTVASIIVVLITDFRIHRSVPENFDPAKLPCDIIYRNPGEARYVHE